VSTPHIDVIVGFLSFEISGSIPFSNGSFLLHSAYLHDDLHEFIQCVSLFISLLCSLGNESISIFPLRRMHGTIKLLESFFCAVRVLSEESWRLVLPRNILYIVWCFSKIYAHKNICKSKFEVSFSNKATVQIRTNVTARIFNDGRLARNHFSSRKSCDKPVGSRYSVVFFGLRANAKLVHKLHIAFHAPHIAFPIALLEFRPNRAIQLSN
jgi:hypothetical protein